MRIFILFEKMNIKNNAYLLLLFAIILLAYIIPVLLLQAPSGTDAYTHVLYTDIMLNSKSLNEFFDICLEERYLSYYDYPFGLWVFGSVVGKITGLDSYTLSYLLPLLLIFILTMIYYTYSRLFIKSERYLQLSVIFLLSMPIISQEILNYSTSKFVMPMLLFIIYLSLNDNISLKKSIVFVPLLLFCLCFTHTGTYMFLLFLAG